MSDKLLKPVDSCKTEQSNQIVTKRKRIRLVYKVITVFFILYNLANMWLNYK